MGSRYLLIALFDSSLLRGLSWVPDSPQIVEWQCLLPHFLGGNLCLCFTDGVWGAGDWKLALCFSLITSLLIFIFISDPSYISTSSEIVHLLSWSGAGMTDNRVQSEGKHLTLQAFVNVYDEVMLRLTFKNICFKQRKC